MFRPCRSKEGKKVLDEKDVPLYSFKLFSFDINLLIVAIIIVIEKEYFKYMTSFLLCQHILQYISLRKLKQIKMN